eukprot:tig00021015_g17153.t1
MIRFAASGGIENYVQLVINALQLTVLSLLLVIAGDPAAEGVPTMAFAASIIQARPFIVPRSRRVAPARPAIVAVGILFLNQFRAERKMFEFFFQKIFLLFRWIFRMASRAVFWRSRLAAAQRLRFRPSRNPGAGTGAGGSDARVVYVDPSGPAAAAAPVPGGREQEAGRLRQGDAALAAPTSLGALLFGGVEDDEQELHELAQERVGAAAAPADPPPPPSAPPPQPPPAAGLEVYVGRRSSLPSPAPAALERPPPPRGSGTRTIVL